MGLRIMPIRRPLSFGPSPVFRRDSPGAYGAQAADGPGTSGPPAALPGASTARPRLARLGRAVQARNSGTHFNEFCGQNSGEDDKIKDQPALDALNKYEERLIYLELVKRWMRYFS
jgi:hypothetical protein